MKTNRRFSVAVLGSYSATEEEAEVAYQLGKALAAWDINVVSGGQKGVMLSLCRGVAETRDLSKTKRCLLVGVLPYADLDRANKYVDVVIPTGAGGIQNMIVPISGDVIIGIGGAAGTLAEISFAWQAGKNIGLIGSNGWAKRLANTRLDDRREDKMPHFGSVSELMDWIRVFLPSDAAI